VMRSILRPREMAERAILSRMEGGTGAFENFNNWRTTALHHSRGKSRKCACSEGEKKKSLGGQGKTSQALSVLGGRCVIMVSKSHSYGKEEGGSQHA